MKKRFTLIISAIMIMLGLSACGEEATPAATELSLDTVYSVEEYADITLKKISTADTVKAPIGGDGYSTDSDSETYVDVLFTVTNTSTKKISSEDLMLFTAKNAEEAVYSGDLYLVEKDNNTSLESWTDINPKATVRFHAAVAVPKDETSLKLNFVLNGEQFIFPYTVGDFVGDVTNLKVGEKIESDDFAALSFKGIEYTDDVLPSDTSYFYNHYLIDDNANTYLVVKYDIKNLQSVAKEAGSFVGVNAVYMDKYRYDGFLVVEQTDRTGFDMEWETIDPLTERHLYYLIEVPKSIAENPVKLNIYFDGQDYVYSE